MAPRRGRGIRLFLHKIINRITITALLLLLQFAWLFYLLIALAQYAVWFNLAMSLVGIVLSLYIIRRDENPAYKLAWLLLFGIMPLFGVLVYALLGNKHLSRRLRRKLEAVEAEHRPSAPSPVTDALPPRFAATCHYLTRYGSYPAYANTDVRYFALGDELFPALLADLERAERYIFLEYFIIAEGCMLDAIMDVLKRKAAAGLDVRIIYDDIGCEAATPLSFVVEAERHGIRCLAFNPIVPLLSVVMNHRDHRKFTIIDGRVAYTGGINIADEYINQKQRFGHWKDTGLRLEGEAVHSIVTMFLNLWNALRPTEQDYSPFLPPPAVLPPSSGRPALVLPYSDSPLDNENVGETVYLEILSQAQDYVYIFTPYLVIDAEMQTALCTAAKRGVDVRIVVPGIPDKKTVFRLTRSYYSVLMQAGVRMYEYAPGFLHAKSFLSDDRIGVVGTINMDYRSLYLHFECGTLLWGGDAVRDLKADCLATIAKSHEIARRELKKPRRLILRFVDAVLRALSPLF